MRLLSIFFLIFCCAAWGQNATFIWPTDGKVISGFDSNRKSIDVAGKAGQPVVAASGGKVIYAKNVRGSGNLIILEHDHGMVTAYAHLQAMLVSEGQTVHQGQQIGKMGDTDADTVKLRFEMRRIGKPIDPVKLLQPHQLTNRVFKWNVKSQHQEKIWLHDKAVISVAYSPDGRYVITGSYEKTAVLRDVQTGNTLQKWQHEGAVTVVAFSPDGQYVVTGSSDYTVVLREVHTSKTLHTWRHRGDVFTVAFSPDGRYVISGSYDKTAALHEVQTGKTLRQWPHDGSVVSVAFSPDGLYVVTGSVDNTAVLREIRTGRAVHTWRHDKAVWSVAYSPDGRYVVTGSKDKTAVLRDVQTGNTLQKWQHEDEISVVALSPDGQYVVTGSSYGKSFLREVQTGKTVHTWTVGVFLAAFSPDGRYVVAGTGSGGTLHLLKVQTGETQFWSVGGDHYLHSVHSVAFSPDSRYVIYGTGEDKNAWQSRSGKVVLRPTGLVIQAPLHDTIPEALKQAERHYRTPPKILADRQSNLEKTRPVKDEFESAALFNARVMSWNQAAEKLNFDMKAYYATLGPLPLGLRAAAFEEAIGQSYGNPELQDIRYDPEMARFFATLKASFDPEFKRTISIAVSNEQARVAKQQLDSGNFEMEVELRVGDGDEFIWGPPKLKFGGKIYLAQYTDKNFIPPVAQQVGKSVPLQNIEPPSVAVISIGPIPNFNDDPSLAKLQTEVIQKEREQKNIAVRQAEEKRLRERLAELDRTSRAGFNDDLPSLLAKLPKAKSNPNIFVLVVGINDYTDVPDVPFADRSANQFAEIAQTLWGAQKQNVIVLTDAEATSGRLRGRLRTLLNRLGPQDQFVFYYAGHGVPGKDGASTYLLAQDGGPGSYEEPDLQLSQIYKAIAQSKVGRSQIFIDACFSGRSSKDTIVFEGIAPVTLVSRQNLPDAQRLAVLTAGRGNQFSNQEKDRGHRLFSYHLMRVLLEDGLKLEIAQIHKKLRERVLNDSRRLGPEFEQEPELLGNGQLMMSQ
jgi:hypothetical protein